MSGEWREAYERHADADLAALSAESLPSLIRRFERREFGQYYVFWDAIASKGDLQAVGWRMFDFLTSDATHHHRYHCARVLLEMLGDKRYEAADLTVAHRNPERAHADVKAELTAAVGPR